jgi:hypothetical protein
MAWFSRGLRAGLGWKAGGRRMGSAGREQFFAEFSSANIINPGPAAKRLSISKPIQASQWNHHPWWQTPSFMDKNYLSIKHQMQYKSNVLLEAKRSLHPVFGFLLLFHFAVPVSIVSRLCASRNP